MKQNTQKALVTALPIAAFAAFAVGHVFALDWLGRRIRAFVQSA